jgi:hypothetical protein
MLPQRVLEPPKKRTKIEKKFLHVLVSEESKKGFLLIGIYRGNIKYLGQCKILPIKQKKLMDLQKRSVPAYSEVIKMHLTKQRAHQKAQTKKPRKPMDNIA